MLTGHPLGRKRLKISIQIMARANFDQWLQMKCTWDGNSAKNTG